jgi:hypothetical protein
MMVHEAFKQIKNQRDRKEGNQQEI